MGLLSNTNIVIDDFMYGKVRESYGYIYFLSHMHSGKILPSLARLS